MDIEKLIARGMTECLPVEELRVLAGDRSVFGDDAVAMFQHQADIRKDGAQTIMTRAQEEGRDLLASEHRNFDRNLVESRMVSALADEVAQRSAIKNFVPVTQQSAPAGAVAEPAEDLSPVLIRTQRFAEHVSRRGGFLYQGERGAESMRFGRIVRALALGDRRGMSALEQRALSEGTDASGGYTVPEIVGAQFIDRVRNAMAVMRAGAITVPMSSDVLHLARIGNPESVSPAIDQAAWKVENADIAETDILLGRVTFTARTLPVLLKLSVELQEDSVNIDEIIERELSQQLALELDRAALLGSGAAPEPRGIRNQVGVNVENLTGVSTADYDFIIDAIGRVWAANHEPNARLYNASLATKIAKFKSSADDQPLRVPEAVAAVAAFRTNQIANTNTSPDATTMFVGDFTQLMIGLRSSFRLEVTRTGGDAFKKLQVWVRAYLRADVQLAHPEAFDVSINVDL